MTRMKSSRRGGGELRSPSSASSISISRNNNLTSCIGPLIVNVGDRVQSSTPYPIGAAIGRAEATIKVHDIPRLVTAAGAGRNDDAGPGGAGVLVCGKGRDRGVSQ